jgi:eukaryotic-like serine/threonine-protein kinase
MSMKSNHPENKEILHIVCPTCKAIFARSRVKEKKRPLAFCAYCGSKIRHEKESAKEPPVEKGDLHSTISVSAEKIPTKEEVQETIGQYQMLRSIGKGGMGEVFLAYDTICGRKIALKRIRGDLLVHPQLQNRFLREAKITSQLTHPTIIPIYSIQKEDNQIYYTMPYVEGQTLRQILKQAKEVEHDELKDPHTSIPALVRLFLQVCQACAYAHSQGVLHRDLKPENFIIGKYGQVLILDWGLAKLITEEEKPGEFTDIPERHESKELQRITRIGKIVGTIAYMAPERALGKPATIQTDIYSLGVTLYQILTLSVPFYRKSLSYFKRHLKKERLVPPEVLAPYREVPQILSEVVKRCLAVDPAERYQSVDELIQSLENYIEGRSEWFFVRDLDVINKSDWQFQEHVLIAEHTAITRTTEVTDWVSLMISKDTFTDNTKIEAQVKIGETGHGIGFMFSLPEAIDRLHPTEGYCLWLSSDLEKQKKTKLLRSSVSVLEAIDLILERGKWYRVRIEKIDHHIYFYLNDILQFSYVSHIPIVGTHVGLLSKDGDLELKNFSISIGSQNLTVGCLAVPDAFLASKDYERALAEYRRIGAAFPGRAEGREALFRAGITLLEKAKNSPQKEAKELYDQAHDEFEKLRGTPGAPLEYLGKALIYQTLEEYDEEIKCFELSLRRYKKHPLILILVEQIAFRMHESASEYRKAAYEFICLAIRFLPKVAKSHSATKLFSSLQKHWEVAPFLLHKKDALDEELQRYSFCTTLAFWLAKPHLLKECVSELLQRPKLPIDLISDSIFFMIELGALHQAEKTVLDIRALLSEAEQKRLLSGFYFIELAFKGENLLHEGANYFLKLEHKKLSVDEERFACFLLRKIIAEEKLPSYTQLLTLFQERKLHSDKQDLLDALLVEAYLYLKDFPAIEKILSHYTKKELMSELSPLYFPYGCYQAAQNGKKRAYVLFSRLLETPHPHSHLLGAHYLVGNLQVGSEGWLDRSFLWERRCLYEQLALFYTAATESVDDEEKAKTFRMQAAKEYVYEE